MPLINDCIIMSNPTNIDMLERLFYSLTIRVYAFCLVRTQDDVGRLCCVGITGVLYMIHKSLNLHAHCVDIYIIISAIINSPDPNLGSPHKGCLLTSTYCTCVVLCCSRGWIYQPVVGGVFLSHVFSVSSCGLLVRGHFG